MLLQTNSYIVPKERKAEHARLMRRFRVILHELGCDSFEIYEQVGANWSNAETSGRFVQIMRFRDRKHQLAVQNAERSDPAAQQLIAEFCELVNYPYQQQQQQFAVGFYSSILPVAPGGAAAEESAEPAEGSAEPAGEVPQEDQGQRSEFIGEHREDATGETADDAAEAEVSILEDDEAPAAQDLAPQDVEGQPAQEMVSEAEMESEDLVEDPRPIPSPEADIDADLEIPDDDLSRLAAELAAEDELKHPQHGGSHEQHHGHGSENGH
jgi:hypothetical protein